MILIYRNITIKNYTRIFFLFLPMIISITGLRPKSILHSIPFWFRAIPSFNQAKNAPGNQFCEVKRIQGIQHTLTAWDDMGTLRAFVGSGAHLNAVKSFRKIATGSTFHYESETVPSWEEARRLWEENYREY
jgi:hypothetical protein